MPFPAGYQSLLRPDLKFAKIGSELAAFVGVAFINASFCGALVSDPLQRQKGTLGRFYGNSIAGPNAPTFNHNCH